MPLIRGHYPPTRPEWLAAGSPAGVHRENMPRRQINSATLAALTTQVMTSVAIPLEAGDLVTSLTFVSGTTAANTPTNWWFALYSTAATPALLGQSADQTSTAWAASTAKTLALATAYLVPASGLYYAAVMVKATTVPTLSGAIGFAVGAGGVLTADLSLASTSGTSLTTTAPATIASPTALAGIPYVVVT